MADGTGCSFGLLANPWKETVRDAMADIRACREAAKVKTREAIRRHTAGEHERRRLYRLLKADRWADDQYLSRIMRKYWRRGHNHVDNQIVVRSDQYRTWTLPGGGNVWLAVPGPERRFRVAIPLNTTVAPTGTLRLILRDGRVEVHYQVDASTLKSAQRPCGSRGPYRLRWAASWPRAWAAADRSVGPAQAQGRRALEAAGCAGSRHSGG
jgi:hypothetical protein